MDFGWGVTPVSVHHRPPPMPINSSSNIGVDRVPLYQRKAAAAPPVHSMHALPSPATNTSSSRGGGSSAPLIDAWGRPITMAPASTAHAAPPAAPKPAPLGGGGGGGFCFDTFARTVLSAEEAKGTGRGVGRGGGPGRR